MVLKTDGLRIRLSVRIFCVEFEFDVYSNNILLKNNYKGLFVALLKNYGDELLEIESYKSWPGFGQVLG